MISWSQRGLNKIDTTVNWVKMFPKFNDFPSQKTKISTFEPLLKVWETYIVWTSWYKLFTIVKVSLLVEIRGQRSPYHKRSGDMDFCVFAQTFLIIFQRGSKNTQPTNIFSMNNLKHLQGTLGDLETRLEFYDRDRVGGPQWDLD